jgi:hypothetical protein
VTAIAGLTPVDNGNVSINVGGTSSGPAQSLLVPIALPPPLGNLTKVPTNMTLAAGQGNIAANIGGSNVIDPSLGVFQRPNRVQAVGVGNAAFNVGGVGNQVQAGEVLAPSVSTLVPALPLPLPSTASAAFNGLGSNNDVIAQGPFAVAGAFDVSKHNILNLNPVVALPGQVRVVTPLNP